MPFAVLERHLAGLPRLQAERSVTEITNAAIAWGSLSDANLAYRRLQRIAAGGDVVDAMTTGDPLSTFAKLHAANDRARAAGQLYEQRVQIAEGV